MVHKISEMTARSDSLFGCLFYKRLVPQRFRFSSIFWLFLQNQQSFLNGSQQMVKGALWTSMIRTQERLCGLCLWQPWPLYNFVVFLIFGILSRYCYFMFVFLENQQQIFKTIIFPRQCVTEIKTKQNKKKLYT